MGSDAELEVYVDLLGNAGIGALEHAALQALHDTASSRRAPNRLAADLLEETARCGGSVDTMLEWFANDCSSAWDYLEMARRCTEHGRERQAIEWLERGAKAHPTEPRILAHLAQAYSRDGFPEDALELRWKAYLLQPAESSYLALRDAALALGPWEPWRERALQALDQRGATTSAPRTPSASTCYWPKARTDVRWTWQWTLPRHFRWTAGTACSRPPKRSIRRPRYTSAAP